MENSEDFLNQLSELIELFRKLRDKATKDGTIPKDDPMYTNFDLLAGNFNLMKNTIPKELIAEMGGPMRDMLADMVNQLKKELGEVDTVALSQTEPADKLEVIDKKLQRTDLSEDEINNLLDKRANLTKD